jgi:hypothetical protein
MAVKPWIGALKAPTNGNKLKKFHKKKKKIFLKKKKLNS